MVSLPSEGDHRSMNSPNRNAGGPLLICFDGSADAEQAIQRAGGLLVARDALVLTVWQPTAALGSFSWGGEAAGMVDFVELDRAGAEDAGRIAEEGVRLAREAGLDAEPIAIKATGPVWKTIVETADAHDAAAIVMGSRGLTGVRSMLLGSVSSAAVHHADRPTLVVHAGSDS
jgi:nucleotide-binding universal stress UspA family protein